MGLFVSMQYELCILKYWLLNLDVVRPITYQDWADNSNTPLIKKKTLILAHFCHKDETHGVLHMSSVFQNYYFKQTVLTMRQM